MISLAYKELELELRREIYSSSYFEFFKWAFSILFPNEKYEDSFHVKYLCDLYQKEVERIIARKEKGKDLIVNIPPRTSKSLITSVALLAWAWIKDPTIPMISISFDDELTLLNAQLCKDIIKSDQYQELFGDLFQIRSDVDSKSHFMNTKGGFRLSKTTGSNITGHKGMIIVVDDPQNPKTAEQEVQRKTTQLYYTRSLYNRLTPANLGIRIIIMQRLHEDDLTGYLLKTDKSSYQHICLPAEVSSYVNPTELKVHYQNGLLDPIRLNKKILTSFKTVLGSRGYSGQYEQTPAPSEGGILKKEWFVIIQPEQLTRDYINEPIHFFIDSAFTAKSENDPTAILACFVKNNRIFIVDVIEVWLEFPELIRFIKTYVNNFQHSSNSKLFIEPKASGKSIVQQLRSETMLNVIEANAPDTDKVTRTNAIAPIVESGRVCCVLGHYIENFVTQCGVFPNGSHDDMVDTLVMAINELLVDNSPDFMFV